MSSKGFHWVHLFSKGFPLPISSDKELLGPEVVTTLHFLQTFVRLAQLPLSVLEQRIPNIILSEFEYLATPLK